jgi:endonuclease YncB( thermonuclease family)
VASTRLSCGEIAPDEIALARDATAALAAIVDSGPVTLLRIEGDKYFGRVVADVSIAQEDVSAMLVENGLVRRYQGGARTTWCGADVAAGDRPSRSLR